MTTEKLQEILDNRFGGVLSIGKHNENGKGCALEVLSIALNKKWTDDPDILRTYDLRPINDIHVANKIRTEHLLPVVAAYAGSLDWPLEKQKTVVSKILVLTVNRIISALPHLPENISVQCKNASTLDEAGCAAKAADRAVAGKATRWAANGAATAVAAAVAEEEAAAAAAAAAEAAEAAEAAAAEAEAAMVVTAAAEEAAEAAEAAAEAAGRWTGVAANEKIFILACEIWMDALLEPGTFRRN